MALGSFDGLHTGHVRVIKKCIQTAAAENLKPVVMLFERHPLLSLTGEAPAALLTTGERDRILRTLGAYPVIIDFDRIRSLSCEEFVRDILAGELSARAVCCGFNYRFGIGGEGSADTLAALCEKYGIKSDVTEQQCFENEPVSSTRIRKALLEGKPRQANSMLGRIFSYTLPVVRGDQRGRTMGFPTANQQLPLGFIVPKYGVYASQTEAHGGIYPSVTNIGVRPTVGENKLLSETHILGYTGELYGENIRVGLLEYLREEKSFPDFSSLSEQIRSDSRAAEKIWMARGL